MFVSRLQVFIFKRLFLCIIIMNLPIEEILDKKGTHQGSIVAQVQFINTNLVSVGCLPFHAQNEQMIAQFKKDVLNFFYSKGLILKIDSDSESEKEAKATWKVRMIWNRQEHCNLTMPEEVVIIGSPLDNFSKLIKEISEFKVNAYNIKQQTLRWQQKLKQTQAIACMAKKLLQTLSHVQYDFCQKQKIKLLPGFFEKYFCKYAKHWSMIEHLIPLGEWTLKKPKYQQEQEQLKEIAFGVREESVVLMQIEIIKLFDQAIKRLHKTVCTKPDFQQQQFDLEQRTMHLHKLPTIDEIWKEFFKQTKQSNSKTNIYVFLKNLRSLYQTFGLTDNQFSQRLELILKAINSQEQLLHCHHHKSIDKVFAFLSCKETVFTSSAVLSNIEQSNQIRYFEQIILQNATWTIYHQHFKQNMFVLKVVEFVDSLNKAIKQKSRQFYLQTQNNQKLKVFIDKCNGTLNRLINLTQEQFNNNGNDLVELNFSLKKVITELTQIVKQPQPQNYP